jgi:hypothetical protein
MAVDPNLLSARNNNTAMNNISFTWNDYSEENRSDVMEKLPYVKYGVIGREGEGPGKTRHLQGYLRFDRTRRFAAIKAEWASINGNTVHFAKSRRGFKANFKYCTKEGDWIEWGDRPEQSGTRNDIKQMLDLVRNGKTDLEIAEELPSEYTKYYKCINEFREKLNTKKGEDDLADYFAGKELRDWQQFIYERLIVQGERKVLWISDAIGNSGKTWFSKWLVWKQKAFYCQGGRNNDVSCAYQNQKFVIFDLCRDTQKDAPYSMIEQMKNGLIWSPKYQSHTKVNSYAKVLVVANWMPNLTKLSNDRWDIIDMEDMELLIQTERDLTIQFEEENALREEEEKAEILESEDSDCDIVVS